jgi:tetratricopeptide (TPR) repeat protein
LVFACGIGCSFATVADEVTTRAPHQGQADGAKSRLVTVLAVADAGYRKRFPEWRARIEGIVSVASDRYENEFSIMLDITDCRVWPFRASLAQREQLNQQLFRISSNDAEIVIAFVENVPIVLLPPGEHTEGYAFSYGRYVVVGDVHNKTTEAEMILIHELAHVFGAFHVGDHESIMQVHLPNVPTRFVFDEATRKVIQLSRNVDLRAGVGSLDVDQVKELRALFRAHGRPDGRVDEEDPIIAGLLHQANRELCTGNAARAREFVLRAQRLSQESAGAQMALAGIAVAQGDNEEAVRRLETAVRLNPESVDAFLDLGRLRLQLGRSRLALQAAERAMGIEARMHGKSERTVLLRAKCRYYTADNKGYEKDLDYLKRNHPMSAEALLRTVEGFTQEDYLRRFPQQDDVDGNNGWPKYDRELDGSYEVRVVNPHDSPVVVGLRCGREGRDFAVAPGRTRKVAVHAGKIDVFFRHRDYPGRTFRGDSFAYRPGGGHRRMHTLHIPKPQSKLR